ncbi:MAG: metal-sensitive transcriptional regulator, partial [Proteobacteria bacterium]|nr:metal-sensitive transcriptional regulator [Pseudomonadota bacterium]
MTEHKHPCHSDQLVRLNRVEGQVRGVARMIEEQQYCVDILNQIKATTRALEAVERAILKTHLRACIK